MAAGIECGASSPALVLGTAEYPLDIWPGSALSALSGEKSGNQEPYLLVKGLLKQRGDNRKATQPLSPQVSPFEAGMSQGTAVRSK